MHQELTNWIIFGVVVGAALTLDMWLSHRGQSVSLKRALVETCGWIGLSVLFGCWIYFFRGHQAGAEYFTAYLIEKSLSADNLFVFLLIFRAFGIEARFQHRVLYTGILAALVMRLAFILAGVQLLNRFHFATYIFGAGLAIFGIRMLVASREFQPESNPLMRLVRKIHPVDSTYRGDKFWTRVDGVRAATPLLLSLVAIEAMDLVFAVDSVPAVLSVTRTMFIAYSSNVFAILGLRAMYFGLAELMRRMRFLHQGLAVILLFVGAKMLASDSFSIPAWATLAVILVILAVTGVASWLKPAKSPAAPTTPTTG
ncbi:MAG TPA: TerC/Alx family metal homeostasis membrane protein [Candidatus Dormibacteraeota bacterium]|nr:TerC/Alx family metal homeostasis membrane protein [Candidatus Dormibacteraeota bacterium]